MKTLFCFALAAASLIVLGQAAAAQDIDLAGWKKQLEGRLVIKGPIDEGYDNALDELLPPRKGETYKTETRPGPIEVGERDNNGRGLIKYKYEAVITTMRYDNTASLPFPVKSERTIKGVVTAKYLFSFTGRVVIEDVTDESGQEHRAGACIVKRLKGLNGKSMME